MTSRRMQFGIALALASCLFLPACRKEGGEGGKNTVTLSADASGNCIQKLNGSPTAVVLLDPGDNVTFQTENSAPFVLQFPPPNVTSCKSPFRDGSGNCQSTFNNSNPTSGPAVGQPSTQFPYGMLSINGATCNLNSGPQPLAPQPMGMRIRP
jgi:hypothetical protein